MTDSSPPSDENELSPEDLAVLQAFEAMAHWENYPTEQPSSTDVARSHTSSTETTQASSTSDEEAFEDMLLLFIAEVEEDIATMRRTLCQIEQGEHINHSGFTVLQRKAHKIRGTAGAIGFHLLASIAHDIELIVEQTSQGLIFPTLGVNVTGRAISALEETLGSIVRSGRESEIPLRELEEQYRQHSIDPRQELTPASEMSQETTQDVHEEEDEEETKPDLVAFRHALPTALAPALSTPVDQARYEQLLQYSEHLAEMRTPVESAQAQVASALQELQSAQARLQKLEPFLTSLLANARPMLYMSEASTSSLIARILNSGAQKHDFPTIRPPRQRSRPLNAMAASPWDNLDMERFTEKDLLVRSLSEAIADVTIASKRVRQAFAHLQSMVQELSAQAVRVRDESFLLRLVPLSVLLPRLRQAIATIPALRGQQVEITMQGERVEVDEDVLLLLIDSLRRFLQVSLADMPSTRPEDEPRVWLHIQGGGNEIVIELGFAMPIQGGTLEVLREDVQRVQGTITFERNRRGGVSFYLHLPRSRGIAHYLLVRAGTERVVVPFAQISRISEVQREQIDHLYHLRELLGFSWSDGSTPRVRPVLLLLQGSSQRVTGVEVDDLIDKVDLVIKPLASALRRPGIAGAVIDGNGQVLLQLDLVGLISHYASRGRESRETVARSPASPAHSPAQPTILIADDSVYLRHSLLQDLQHANYRVVEARDGLEALEQLFQHSPDILLLDVEMPNLNGYDLLRVMHRYPELDRVKVIMLSTRSSQKHIRHALELGAREYITKPYFQEALLAKIEEVLAQ